MRPLVAIFLVLLACCPTPSAGTQGNTAVSDNALFSFADYYDQPLTLRGVNQNACVNTEALGSGGNWGIDVEWTEE